MLTVRFLEAPNYKRYRQHRRCGEFGLTVEATDKYMLHSKLLVGIH